MLRRDEILPAAAQRAADVGLVLEATYTGKALAALLADAQAGRLRGRRVLFIDSYAGTETPRDG